MNKIFERVDYFPTPIWSAMKPEFVAPLNEATNKYIDEAKIDAIPKIKEKNKKFGDVGDLGYVYHSISDIRADSKFVEFQKFIKTMCANLLAESGFNITNYKLIMNEMWVQEFAKAGHHSVHEHWNGHISGFYFLKASDKTSEPLFHDPRPGRAMNLLPEISSSLHTLATNRVQLGVEPGRLLFFPSYLPHEFTMDMGVEPFRFIHWNCQAVPNEQSF